MGEGKGVSEGSGEREDVSILVVNVFLEVRQVYFSTTY